jgi:hypothetical protein
MFMKLGMNILPYMVFHADYVLSLLQNANTNRNLRNGEQVLDAEEFVTFYMNLMSRSEVKELFTRYTELASGWVLIIGQSRRQNIFFRVR